MVKKLSFSIFVLILILSLVSCTIVLEDKNQKNEQEPTEEVKSAYDSLTEDEKQVFNAFVVAVKDKFYVPQSARIIMVSDAYIYSNGGVSATLKVQANNRAGGGLTDWFNLYSDSSSGIGASIYQTDNPSHTGSNDDGIDANRLNRAIKEYWEKNGY